MMLVGLVFLPLVLGIGCMLLRRQAPVWTGTAAAVTAAIAVQGLVKGAQPVHFLLIHSFGVSLLIDSVSAWFLLTNAAITLAVVLHARDRSPPAFFYTLLVVLHGCLNACFLCNDLFNLYVVIELSTISAFLLIGYRMKDRQLWNALRYLFISNVGMLFFLMGVIMVYQTKHSFALGGIADASPIAAVLVITGLMVKGGVFLPGLWLPLAHSEAEAPVSAMLSGIVVKIGVFPLIRIAMLSEKIKHIITILGVGGVALGLFLAFFQRDIKRLLACSTISQIGFMLAAPSAGAFYAFSHGLAKAGLFLLTGHLPGRDLLNMKKAVVPPMVFLGIPLLSLSIAGMPPLIGFKAKVEVLQGAVGWLSWFMTGAGLGTAALMTRLVLLPLKMKLRWGGSLIDPIVFLLAICLALGIITSPYEVDAWFKAGALILAGWILYFAGLRFLARLKLPDRWERFEDLVGMTCLVLLALMIYVGLT